jgi:hypothetical protein
MPAGIEKIAREEFRSQVKVVGRNDGEPNKQNNE